MKYLKKLNFILCLLLISPLSIKGSIEFKNDHRDLINAAKHGDKNTVKELLEDPTIDINAQNKQGETALTGASWLGNPTTVEMLLDKGADINIQDKKGDTALILSSWKGYLEIVEMLLDKGADINHQNKEGDTALMWAAHSGHLEVAKMILKAEADINHQNEYGDTALMWAAMKGHPKFDNVVNMLIEKGARINIKDEDGETALNLAKKDSIIKTLDAALKEENELLVSGYLRKQEKECNLSSVIPDPVMAIIHSRFIAIKVL